MHKASGSSPSIGKNSKENQSPCAETSQQLKGILSIVTPSHLEYNETQACLMLIVFAQLCCTQGLHCFLGGNGQRASDLVPLAPAINLKHFRKLLDNGGIHP